MNCKSHNGKTLDFALKFLVLYVFAGFVFYYTKLQSSFAVYACFTLLLGIFALCLALGGGKIQLGLSALLWIPFVLYTMGAYLLNGDIEHFAYWCVCLFILLMSTSQRVGSRVPWKLIYIIGIIALVGIGVQIFFSNFYNSNIATFFTNTDRVLYWGRAYGFAGFTYQLDTTAMPILYAEGVYLFLISNSNGDKKWTIKRLILLQLFVVGVFLTGKRMLSLLAVVAPIFTYFLSQKNLSKKLGAVFVALILFVFAYMYLYLNAEQLHDSIVFRRIAAMIIDLKTGEDTTTGRSYLYSIAIDSFKSSPILGIGLGNFINKAGAYSDVHNTFLQILCEQGLLGMVLFAIPLIYCLCNTIGTLKNLTTGQNKKLLQISLYCQIIYIMYSFSGNTNINLFGYIIYFLAITALIEGKRGYVSRSWKRRMRLYNENFSNFN
jgi:O-antigen ligase